MNTNYQIMNMTTDQDELVREYLAISLSGLRDGQISSDAVERSKEIRDQLNLAHEQIIDLGASILK